MPRSLYFFFLFIL